MMSFTFLARMPASAIERRLLAQVSGAHASNLKETGKLEESTDEVMSIQLAVYARNRGHEELRRIAEFIITKSERVPAVNAAWWSSGRSSDLRLLLEIKNECSGF